MVTEYGMANTFEGCNPIFRVSDLSASIKYYTVKLGFKLNWGNEEAGFASVKRDKFDLFLCQGDQGNFGTWVWVGVSDAAALYEEYQKSGGKIRHPPTNYAWAYEMQVEDLDGNVLRFGSEPLDGEAHGEWLDMYGRRWGVAADGKPFLIEKD